MCLWGCYDLYGRKAFEIDRTVLQVLALKGECKMKKTGKGLYWAPRILSILFICFLSLFSLDVFEPGKGIGELLLGLFMHNIPSIIMAVLLAIAWRKDIVGAVSYFGAGLLYIGLVAFSAISSGFPWYLAITRSLPIAGPAFIIGALFLINWKNRKAMHNSTKREKTDGSFQ